MTGSSGQFGLCLHNSNSDSDTDSDSDEGMGGFVGTCNNQSLGSEVANAEIGEALGHPPVNPADR